VINTGLLQSKLCNIFCSEIGVHAVPMGLAISTAFSDKSGDRLGFYLVEDDDGYRIQDDGQYLSDLVAFGIPIEHGTRGQLLDSILSDSDSYWDRESFEIVSNSFSEAEVSERLINFISSLIRVRDLELLTREVVKSTFREDAIAAMTNAFGDSVEIDENTFVDRDLADFPVDVLIRPKNEGSKLGAVYFINSTDKINEALLLQMEAESIGRNDFSVIGLVEDPEMRKLNKRKFQRAQNRRLVMPIFRGDEKAAMKMISGELRISQVR